MRFRLVLLSLVSVALYVLLALRSDVEPGAHLLAQWYRPRLFEASVEFIGIWVALFVVYVIAVRLAAGRGEGSFFAIIFISSILFRVALFLGSGFEHSAPGVFLYGPSPLTAFVARLELGLTAERVVAAACDLGALALAPSLLKGARLPLGAAVIHGWNPLVITEVAGSGRIAVIAFMLLLLSLRLIQNSARWPAAIVYGASLSGPLMLVASVPLVAKAGRARLVLAFGLALVAWSLAFPETTWIERAGWPPAGNLGGSITPALLALTNLFVTRNDSIPLLLALAVWALFVGTRAARSPGNAQAPLEALLALGSFVLVSIQVLPWAFVAFAYFAAYSTNRGWLAFTATAPMAYLAMEGGRWSFWLGFSQYFVPYALLIFYWLGRPPRTAAGSKA
ncbi:MAG: hypothetical protein BMS9Abin37_2701 [Acidobacteriota bacterium]|nr:MAG: hypothetical protein BMS9Abin37_2701 [Acidobacteriota bacterium]